MVWQDWGLVILLRTAHEKQTLLELNHQILMFNCVKNHKQIQKFTHVWGYLWDVQVSGRKFGRYVITSSVLTSANQGVRIVFVIPWEWDFGSLANILLTSAHWNWGWQKNAVGHNRPIAVLPLWWLHWRDSSYNFENTFKIYWVNCIINMWHCVKYVSAKCIHLCSYSMYMISTWIIDNA